MADIPLHPNGLDSGSQKIINLLAGVAGTDAVNVDQLNAAIAGGVQVIGAYDVALNTPDLVTPAPGAVNKGDLYVASTVGTFFGENIEIGDTLIAMVDNPSALGDWIIVQDNIDSSLLPTQDEKDALTNSNSPSSSNPFTTVADFKYISDYFVSDDKGDDTNDGLSEPKAFKTLEKALDTGEAGGVPYAVHILDDAEYEIQAASGTRTDTVFFKLIHTVATIKGPAGGLIWKVPNSQIDGIRVIGTNLTFEPSSTDVEVQHNWKDIEDQNLLYRSSGAAQDNFRIQVRVFVMRGDNGFCDLSNNGRLWIIGQVSQSVFNSASDEGVFKVSGSGSAVTVFLQNPDGKNNGAGDAFLLHVTDNATGFINGECKTNNIKGGFADTGGSIYSFLSGINGEPAVYEDGGSGVIKASSLAQGLDFQWLNATAGLDLLDLIDIHDISTGEQVKATLTELAALIGGSMSNIIVQKDDVTIGTVTDTLNFEGAGVLSVVDDGGNKTTVTIGGGGGFLTSTLTPAQITAHQNDYSPASLAINQMLRLDSDANYDITGLDSTGFSDRDTIVIINIGSKDLKLKENSGSSLAANRFLINADISLQAEEAATLVYDATSSRWRCIGEHV